MQQLGGSSSGTCAILSDMGEQGSEADDGWYRTGAYAALSHSMQAVQFLRLSGKYLPVHPLSTESRLVCSL